MPKFLFSLFVCLFGLNSMVSAFEQDQRAVSVLQYHHVSDDTPFLTSIPPDTFETHLDYLVEQQFDVISLSEFVERLKQGRFEPKKTAVITFDDAYDSIYTTAWPMLKARNMPFSVFVNTQSVDQKTRHSMSWDQMKEMADQGVEFANHTYSHVHMNRTLEGESETSWLLRIRKEVEVAEQAIEVKLGQSHKVLAYPFGEYNPAIKLMLGEMGYVAFAQHSGAVGVLTDVLAIPRFPFGGYYTELDGFKTKVNALAMPVRRVRLGHAVTSASYLDSVSEPITVLSDMAKKNEVVNVGNPLLGVQQWNKQDWLYLNEDKHPAVMFELELSSTQSKQIACYASGQGLVPMALMGHLAPYSGFIVEAVKPAPVGRSRFNCTIPSMWSGRFYWFSQPIIRLAEHDQWYPE